MVAPSDSMFILFNTQVVREKIELYIYKLYNRLNKHPIYEACGYNLTVKIQISETKMLDLRM